MKSGLYIMDYSHWQINNVKDLGLFFSALTILADSDLVLCLSEGAWEKQTIRILEDISLKNYFYPVNLSEFKNCFFIEVNDNNISFLNHLSEISAEPEVALHISLIWKNERILEWFDIPEDPISISNIISEEKVNMFALKCSGSKIQKR
jgi:hypothetical protein